MAGRLVGGPLVFPISVTTGWEEKLFYVFLWPGKPGHKIFFLISAGGYKKTPKTKSPPDKSGGLFY